MDLTEPGWHVSTNPLRAMEIPTVKVIGVGCLQTFLRYFLHYRTGEPMWEGAEGEGTGIYGEPLKAVPQPDIPQESAVDDVRDYFSPHTYFHGNVQRALWQLGDYGVSADAWRLFNHGQKFEALQEQELWVLRAEAHARLERQKYEQAKTELAGINAMS
ncbi:hypothetical protein BC826DRAFT_976800 [Russula brevipes]|nr:hypothetical protein BC826DRAFT_976800 [Russula brevipes]